MTHIDKKSEAQSALPPVDGLEVVGLIEELREQAALMSDPTNELLTEAAEALSQASSVIAGLTAERDEAVDRAKVWEHYWSHEVKVKSEVVSWAKEFMAKVDTAEACISSLEEENKRLREALEPSASTKSAYMGEFSIAVERHVNEDEEVDDEAEGSPDPYEHVTVPWTTIKEIMAAIRAYAQSEAHNG